MIDWEIVRSIAAILAVILSLTALLVARSDKSREAAQNALSSMEKKFNEKVDNVSVVSHGALTRVEHNLSKRIDESNTLGQTRFDAMNGQLQTLSTRFAGLDEALKSIPTHRDLDVIQNAIANMGNSLSKQQGALEANTRMVERMNQFLMEKGT